MLVVGNDGLKPSYWEMTAGAANAADINFASSARRAVRAERRAREHRQPRPGRTPTAGTAREGVRPRQGRRPADAPTSSPSPVHPARAGSASREEVANARRVPGLAAGELRQRRAHPDRRRRSARRSWTSRSATARRPAPRGTSACASRTRSRSTQPPDELFAFLSDPERVVTCLPGASDRGPRRGRLPRQR